MNEVKSIITTEQPTCNHDRQRLLKDLQAPFVWVSYPSGHGGFLGKSEATIKAEDEVLKCRACMIWLYERGNHESQS